MGYGQEESAAIATDKGASSQHWVHKKQFKMTQKAAELLQLNHDKFLTNKVEVLTTIVSTVTIYRLPSSRT